VPGNSIRIEANLTLDMVEQISGMEHISSQMKYPCTLTQLVDRLSSYNINFIEKDEALNYFTTENFLSCYARGERQLRSEWLIRYPRKAQHWLSAAITLIEDPYNQDIKLFLWMQDITEEKVKQLEIRERSEKDGMTGVYNRKTAEELIYNNLKNKVPGIFLLVDMDRLKYINDVHGHKEGDKAIRGMAEILKSQFRSNDIVGRIGGDEFVIYLPGAAQNKDTISEVFSNLIKRLNAITVGERNDVAISCSIGCTIEQENSTYESLYHQADLALYQVKKNGKNNFAFYSPDFGENSPKSS
jgi:diguanylate cyclase (GGDEF)-like protein